MLRVTRTLIAVYSQGQKGQLQEYQVVRLRWVVPLAVTRPVLPVQQQRRRLDIVHHRLRYHTVPSKMFY